jgi:hypothetical protein
LIAKEHRGSLSGVARFGFPASLIGIWVALQGTGVQAQQRGGTVQTDKVQPVNSGANARLALFSTYIIKSLPNLAKVSVSSGR